MEKTAEILSRQNMKNLLVITLAWPVESSHNNGILRLHKTVRPSVPHLLSSQWSRLIDIRSKNSQLQ